MTRPTPSQTAGPYFAIGLCYQDRAALVPVGSRGAVSLTGAVSDGLAAAVPDALIELWQPDAAGAHPGPEEPGVARFTGFGRCPTDANGEFEFLTVKPGPIAGPGGLRQAPHIEVSIFARGLLKRLVTRIYFDDEPEANAADPVLSSVAPERRPTLIAVTTDGGYRHDIRLQGEGETVFFDV